MSVTTEVLLASDHIRGEPDNAVLRSEQLLWKFIQNTCSFVSFHHSLSKLLNDMSTFDPGNFSEHVRSGCNAQGSPLIPISSRLGLFPRKNMCLQCAYKLLKAQMQRQQDVAMLERPSPHVHVRMFCCGLPSPVHVRMFATHLGVPNEHLLAHFWGLMGALSKVQFVRSALTRNDGPRHVVGRGLEKGH